MSELNWHEYKVIKTKWWGTHRFEIVRNDGKRIQSKTNASDKRIKKLMENSVMVSRRYQTATKSTIYEMVYRGQ